jgi:hypothetical protein
MINGKLPVVRYPDSYRSGNAISRYCFSTLFNLLVGITIVLEERQSLRRDVCTDPVWNLEVCPECLEALEAEEEHTVGSSGYHLSDEWVASACNPIYLRNMTA